MNLRFATFRKVATAVVQQSLAGSDLSSSYKSIARVLVIASSQVDTLRALLAFLHESKLPFNSKFAPSSPGFIFKDCMRICFTR